MLTTQITARNFGAIGQIGQTPGFLDFTNAQIASNGYAHVAQRTTQFNSLTLFAGQLTDTDGKLKLVSEVETAVQLYLDTVFDTVNRVVDAKIFINNIHFDTEATVPVIDKDSAYVDRFPTTTVYWTVKVQVL